jgi:hypothetical protein
MIRTNFLCVFLTEGEGQTDGLEDRVGVERGKVFAGQGPSNPPELLVLCLLDVLQLNDVFETVIKHAVFV